MTTELFGYQAFAATQLQSLKQAENYRHFADLARARGPFPGPRTGTPVVPGT